MSAGLDCTQAPAGPAGSTDWPDTAFDIVAVVGRRWCCLHTEWQLSIAYLSVVQSSCCGS